MGLFDRFRSKGSCEELNTLGFTVSDLPPECEACTTLYPKSVSIEEDGQLWGSAKPYGLHLVVSTNKTDWSHDAVGQHGTVAHAVDKWAQSAHLAQLEPKTIKVSVSSFSSLKYDTNDLYMAGKQADVLVLPFFVWVRAIEVDNASIILDDVVGKLVEFRERELKLLPIIQLPQFPDVEVAADTSKAYIFLCSHRTRDKRCGITAPIMRKEMEFHLRDLGLYRDPMDERPGGIIVGFINHVGGHKYSANVIIYSKHTGQNVWLARCKPNNAAPIIDEVIMNEGRIWPEKIRQVQKFKCIEW